jgi:mitofilin
MRWNDWTGLDPVLVSDLRSLASHDTLIKSLIDAIPEHVHKVGIAPLEYLLKRYDHVEDALVQSTFMPDQMSVFGYLTSIAFNSISVKQRALVQGNSETDIISRAGYYINQKDIANAVKELDSLPVSSKAYALSRDWVNLAKNRLIMQQMQTSLASYAVTFDGHNSNNINNRSRK